MGSLLPNIARDLVTKDRHEKRQGTQYLFSLFTVLGSPIQEGNDQLEQVQQKTIKMIRGCKYTMHKERPRAEWAQP